MAPNARTTSTSRQQRGGLELCRGPRGKRGDPAWAPRGLAAPGELGDPAATAPAPCSGRRFFVSVKVFFCFAG